MSFCKIYPENQWLEDEMSLWVKTDFPVFLQFLLLVSGSLTCGPVRSQISWYLGHLPEAPRRGSGAAMNVPLQNHQEKVLYHHFKAKLLQTLGISFNHIYHDISQPANFAKKNITIRNGSVFHQHDQHKIIIPTEKCPTSPT